MIDPRTVESAVLWSSLSTPDLLSLGASFPRLDNDLYWVDWASYVIQNPTIAAKSPPDPRFFSKWQEWAIRFNQAVFS